MPKHDQEHTIGSWLADSARSFDGRTAVNDRGVLTSYQTLYARSFALAARFRAAGYGAGSRIVTISGNSTDQVVVFFACALTGLAFVPLSWRLTERELTALITRIKPDLVLIEDEYATLGVGALRALETATVSGDTGGIGPNQPEVIPPHAELGLTGVEIETPRCRVPRVQRDPRSDDALLVIFTSGSEAAPKGVVLTHASCFWTNHALSRVMPLTGDDVVLAILPQYHVAAWNVQPLLAWCVGATVVLERSFQPGRVLQLIEDRRVTHMMGVPTQYQMLFDHCVASQVDLSSLRVSVVGGSTITEKLALGAAQRGFPLYQGYGLTEAGPNVLCLRNEELTNYPGTVGRPYPTVETRLTDPDTGLTLEGDSIGELWVRCPGMFAGYLDDEVETAATIVDGWLRTGDLVHRNAAGIHRIIDRLKHMYVSGGENVAPAEVEAALALHPLVERVAVVAVPDPVWGERGLAFVVTRAPLTQDELMTHARAHLAAYKVPVHLRFVESLPTSSIEKIARAGLQELARAANAQGTDSAEPTQRAQPNSFQTGATS